MTPLSIITEALRAIPEWARRALLVTFALAVVTFGALQILDVNTGKMADVLVYLGGYLGVQSAANVGDPREWVGADYLGDSPHFDDDYDELPFEE